VLLRLGVLSQLGYCYGVEGKKDLTQYQSFQKEYWVRLITYGEKLTKLRTCLEPTQQLRQKDSQL